MVFIKMFGFYFVVLIAALWTVRAQNGDVVTCINQLTDWCSKMKFNNGYSNFLTTEVTSSGQYMIHCMSGSGGTNCTRNNSPWFSCPPDNKVRYKGSVLQKDSTDGADSEICDATRKATMMQGGFVYDKKAKEAFNRGMENLQRNLQPLRRSCFPFCENNPFGKGFPFNNGK